MKVKFIVEGHKDKVKQARKLFKKAAKKKPQNLKRMVRIAKLEQGARAEKDAKKDME